MKDKEKLIWEIEELIKIKECRGLSYEQIAQKMGVSFQSVLRWMKKGDKPSILALAQIRLFIKEDARESRRENQPI